MLEHRNLRSDEFWKEIPGWKNVTKEEFGNHLWQMKNSILKVSQIKTLLGNRISDDVMAEIEKGQNQTPMNIRITPYIFSLMNWDRPENDPLRKQFLPFGSQFLPDHPFFMLDSLAEDEDSPVPLLTHRYPDKVLFLPLAVCPVYCGYCTRSRKVGGSTGKIEKETYGASGKGWDKVFEYIEKTQIIEDVVISGGDASMLTPLQVKQIGETLLKIPHIRRIRYATKGVAVWPQKFITDKEWITALIDVKKFAKTLGKQVVVHTHFSSPNEITEWSKKAMDVLFNEDIIVRNQAVLQAGVNDSVDIMALLVKKLSYINLQPYYVFLHDMVQGCEHLRTTLKEAKDLEKGIKGVTAGFNSPTFVCDAPGGGGKRNIYSHEYYDEENGISIWTAPYVKPGKVFTYFDPIHKLSKDAQKRWADEKLCNLMVKEAKKKLGL